MSIDLSVQTSFSAAPAIGINGTLDDATDYQILTMKNVEASASIPFGRAVCFKLSSPASDLDALLPAAETDTVAGIVRFSHGYSRAWTDDAGTVHGELDGTGIRTGFLMDVVRKGRMLLVCEDGCVPGDRLWVRAVAGGDPEFLGGLNNADDSTDMIDCTKQGVWESTATAGGLAWLNFNFVAKP